MDEYYKEMTAHVALYGLNFQIARRAGFLKHFSIKPPLWKFTKSPFLGTPCPATQLRVLPSGQGEYDLFKLRPVKARGRKKM